MQSKLLIKDLLPSCLEDSYSKVRAAVVSADTAILLPGVKVMCPISSVGLCHLYHCQVGLATALAKLV